MVSDKERREAAARLRALDIHDWYDFADEIDSLESAIECNVGQRFESKSWWHRLADLIDMQTCRNVSKPDGGFECSECGCYADSEAWRCFLSCGSDGETAFSYCPHCGRMVTAK